LSTEKVEAFVDMGGTLRKGPASETAKPASSGYRPVSRA
jgi:hypothetical protein